ncbi:MAG: VCBS repeat-containing protein [Akkermansiaceae bacterium]
MKFRWFWVWLLLFAACKEKTEKEGKRTGADSSSEQTISSEKLEVQPSVEGTMFRQLSKVLTGIDFRHEWTPSEKEKVLIAREVAGGGVAVGDLDGDLLPEILFTRPFGGARLYRNLGGMRFEDVTQKVGLGVEKEYWSTGVTMADIDKDGDLDLAFCGFDVPCRIYLNPGTLDRGRFAQLAGVGFKGATIQWNFADTDLDGDLDAFLVANRYSYSGNRTFRDQETIEAEQQIIRDPNGGGRMPDHLVEKFSLVPKGDGSSAVLVKSGQFGRFFRNEDGRGLRDLTAQSQLFDNGLSLAATWWDRDQDGLPDLYLANDFYGADRLFMNQGENVFRDDLKSTLPQVPWFSMGTDVGDINNDGLIDFFATDMQGSNHYKAKIGMGDPSTTAWFLDSSDPKQLMHNMLYLNTRSGRCLEIAHYAGVSGFDWVWSPRLADFDCDGWTDLFVTNGMTGDWTNSDLAEAWVGLSDEEILKDVELKLDTNRALRNTGKLSFEGTAEDWGLDVESVSFGCATGDLDGDGDLDLVVNNFDAAPFVYENRSVANRVTIRLEGRKSNSWGIGARVEAHTSQGIQTRYLTLARGFMSSSEPLIHFGLGEDDVIAKLVIHWPSGLVQSFEELRANHRYTIREEGKLASGEQEKEVMFAKSEKIPKLRHREKKFDDFVRQPLLPNKQSQFGPGLALADVNGDGNNDVFQGGAAGDKGKLLLGDGEGGFVNEAELISVMQDDEEYEDMGCLFIDVDGDGDLDLYVASGGVECDPGSSLLSDRLYVNEGEGSFQKAGEGVLPAVRESSSCVVAADYDGDGDLDLFVGARAVPGDYPTGGRSVLLRNDSQDGQVKFSDAADDLGQSGGDLGIVNGAIWTDVNADGFPDLVLAREWDSMAVLINRGGRLEEVTEETGLENYPGWWNSVVSADVDGDGDFDLLCGNFGLNTKYHPTAEKPIVLYYGDMDGSGKKRIVESKFEGDRPLPVRGRG